MFEEVTEKQETVQDFDIGLYCHREQRIPNSHIRNRNQMNYFLDAKHTFGIIAKETSFLVYYSAPPPIVFANPAVTGTKSYGEGDEDDGLILYHARYCNDAG